MKKQVFLLALFISAMSISASEGALKGQFSVAADEQVFFSQGNLQYQASTDTWRFAENQYDMVGADNKNISATYTGWIDLFGWGTSGFNQKYPWMTSTDSEDYGNGANDIDGTNYDWGRYNLISNGSDEEGYWYTLTNAEWEYLLNQRPNAASLRAPATVMGVKGFILMPDGWVKPASYRYDPDATDFTTNTYNTILDSWKKMEEEGAVFLPAAGSREGTIVGSVGTIGYYWTASASPDSEIEVGEVYFSTTDVEDLMVTWAPERSYGSSVRLVLYAGEPEGIDDVPSDQVQSTKELRNGMLIIRVGDKEYNAQGQKIK